jgi:hypothetical protein
MTSTCSRLRLFVAALVFAWCGAANAYWLGLNPSNPTQPLTGVFSVDVVISGLQTEGQILSTYDFTISFDATILQLINATSSGALGSGAFSFASGLGSVNLFELSFDTDAQLAALQSDFFTVTTLVFTGIGVGTSPLTFTDLFALGGAQFQGQTTDLLRLPFTVGAGSATITPNQVPEPGSLLLVALALPLLAATRVRRPPRRRH